MVNKNIETGEIAKVMDITLNDPEHI